VEPWNAERVFSDSNAARAYPMLSLVEKITAVALVLATLLVLSTAIAEAIPRPASGAAQIGWLGSPAALKS
jgi:hypothetical protein